MSNSININGQTIKLPQSTTGGPSLLVLGYALYSSQLKNGSGKGEIKVNEEGRFNFLNELESAQLLVTSSLNCLGVVMTDLRYEETESTDLKNIGYLIAALSDLQMFIDEIRGMVPLPTNKEVL